uniref:Uncharacterized protein n=1 Tax=Meloidogyne javanica TaxID=6303 RepID=A0A915MSC9_MELJA
MRIEWYRNIRRRHDEIEEMASRPFASIQLDLGGDSMKSHVDPCAVEPCSNYQAGVYTVIVKLPTGGQTYTPFGTSGLAVASALCQLTSAQLALLQPPNTEKRPKRKSNLKPICLCAASEEVETTMDGYNPKLNDTTVPDRVKRNPPPAPSNNDNSKCVKDPAQIHESSRGLVALGSIVACVLCLGLMLAVACGCICTETKMIDVE